MIAATLILFGTLFPLFVDALSLPKSSIGAPYFEIAFMFPMLPLLLLVGIGMHTAWKVTPIARLRSAVTIPLIVAPVLSIALLWLVYGRPSLLTVVGTTAAVWIMLAALVEPLRKIRGDGAGVRMGRAVWGMHIAHFGVGLFALGATVASTYSVETDQSIRIGESVEVAGAEFVLRDLRRVAGPNYEADEGEFEIRRNGTLIGLVAPQKRVYRVQQNAMTEAGIDGRLARDWFVALGEPLGGGAWSVRIQYKPLLRLIWLGALIMALGGGLAALDRRYFRGRASVPAPARQPVVGDIARDAAT